MLLLFLFLNLNIHYCLLIFKVLAGVCLTEKLQPLAAILMEIPYYFAFALKNLFNDHVCNDLSVLLNLPDH